MKKTSLLILALIFVQFIAICDSNGQDVISIKALFDKLPNVSYRYTIDGPRYGRYAVEFIKYGNKYSYKKMKPAPNGTEYVAAMCSFDGKSYYNLTPSGEMIVGTDPLKGAGGACATYLQSYTLMNPPFILAGYLHDQSIQNPFIYPNILSVESWIPTVERLKASVTKNDSGILYNFERSGGAKFNMTCLDGNPILPKSLTGKSDKGMRFSGNVVEWFVLNTGHEKYKLPVNVETFSAADGKETSLKRIFLAHLDDKSVKLLDSPPDISSFRVPAALAKYLIDTDLSTKFSKLNN